MKGEKKKRSKATHRAFAMSLSAMLLCIAMLIGATFAWFTDTASTNVNTIQAGTLDVELYYADNTTGTEATWTKITDKTGAMNFVKAAEGAGQPTLWEPGCTYSLPALKIKNEGNLALKYKVLFTAVDTDAENLELAKVLDVTMNGAPAGTLYDVLTSTDEDGYAHGNLEGNAETAPITLSVKMRESADGKYEGLSIGGIAITVAATQDTVEYDSYDNTYDSKAEYSVVEVTSTDALTDALEKGKDVVLKQDLVLTDSVAIPTNTDATIETNGNTLTCKSTYGAFNLEEGANLTVTGGGEINVSNTKDGAQRVFNVSDENSTLTISDVKVNTDNGFVAVEKGTVIIEGGTYNITNGGSAVFAYGEESKVIINGGTFTGTDKSEGAVYAFNGASVEINGGTFNFVDEDSVNWTLCDYSQMTSYPFTYGGVKVETAGKISVKGGTFNKDISKLPNYKYDGGFSVVNINYLAEGYKTVQETKEGATWYKVVAE